MPFNLSFSLLVTGLAFLALPGLSHAQSEETDELGETLAGLSDESLTSMLQRIDESGEFAGKSKELEESSLRALDELSLKLKKMAKRHKGVKVSSKGIREKRSTLIVIPTLILFESGRDLLKAPSERLLREVRRTILESIDDDSFLSVRIVGHTDTDKRIGDPQYVVLPKNRKNFQLAHFPGKLSVDGSEVRDWGVNRYVKGRPYRLLPISDGKYAVVSTQNGIMGEAFSSSYTYNYLLGLSRAGIVQRYLFDSGDVDEDDVFSQFSNVHVEIDSEAFCKPLNSNHPVVYRTEAEAVKGRSSRKKNRRVEIHVKIWEEGMSRHIEDLHVNRQIRQEQYEEAKALLEKKKNRRLR